MDSFINETRLVDVSSRPSGVAFEPHFSVQEVSSMWGVGRETVRQLSRDEPGVLRFRIGGKKKNTRYSIPESVVNRLHSRFSDLAVSNHLKT